MGLRSNTTHRQTVSSNGRFEIRNVVPGDYMLRVEDFADPVRWAPANQHITVDGDMAGVEMVARRSARVQGRVVRDDGEPLPFDPRTIQVALEQHLERRPGMPASFRMGAWGGTRLDGTFFIESAPGFSSVQVSNLPAGWTVKYIRLGGSDITDEATDFGEGVRREVEIVLTNQVSQVVGRVTDRDARPVSNYTVVVFPEDVNRWRPSSRLVRGVRPDQDGLYRITELPPAAYRAVAVDSLPFNAWTDPKVLELLWSSSVPFRLGEGEQRTVNLRLSPKPDGLP